MIKDLSAWRRKNHLVRRDGTAANAGRDNAVAVAKAEYFLSRAGKEVTSSLDTHSTMPVLQALCNEFEVPWKPNDRKAELMKKLVKYYSKNVSIVPVPLPEPPEGEGPLLGLEVVAEIKADMQRTNLPNWLKRPPLNFATTDHGKLASEEHKSLSLVSLPITLIRLWSSNPELRQYLDHLLQLSVAVRILSYQSLTDRDRTLFKEHYQQYLDQLKSLYPYSSITPVQHLGLHIPYFLHKLGPSTWYSENTCEMFIGMLEDISTNSRIGELEQTLHRELIMAANLSAMISKGNFSETLGPLADIIGKFLDKRYNSSGQQLSVAWSTKHKCDPMTLDQATHDALSVWARNNQTRGFARHLYVCDELSRGHVVYQPFTDARNNSGILFRPRGAFTAVAGRVEAILQESDDIGAPRIIILARNFVPLSLEDAAQDPYRNHPVVGIAHLDIMRLYYDAVDVENMHIIELEDIVLHIAVCSFADPHHTISAPSAVVVDLDMKHHFHS
ncbi:hypothetical protein FRC09_016172 [Ceratobasidium sp. 395]|nr:hypothetical protein FRC09_016172 [Ceratobasidium sp. 395]